MEPTFKDQNPELQNLARELWLVRDHNLKFKKGDPQDGLLLFAEGTLCLLALERFLRILPGLNATERETLPKLLKKATHESQPLLRIADRDATIKRVVDLRNAMLHGNYEQAARLAGAASSADYFGTRYSSDVEWLYQFTHGVMAQIVTLTGRPIA